MAMPSSGQIAIISVPQTCGSISCAVDGNNTPPKSLLTLANTAGKAKCMTAFYGYNPITWHCVDFCQYATAGSDGSTCSTKCTCMTYKPAMAAGECYCACFCFGMCRPATEVSGSFALDCMTCNGTSVYCYCDTSGAVNAGCAITIKNTDTIIIISTACSKCTACAGADWSRVCLYSIAIVAGCYCQGTGVSMDCAVSG